MKYSTLMILIFLLPEEHIINLPGQALNMQNICMFGNYKNIKLPVKFKTVHTYLKLWKKSELLVRPQHISRQSISNTNYLLAYFKLLIGWFAFKWGPHVKFKLGTFSENSRILWDVKNFKACCKAHLSWSGQKVSAFVHRVVACCSGAFWKYFQSGRQVETKMLPIPFYPLICFQAKFLFHAVLNVSIRFHLHLSGRSLGVCQSSPVF